MSTGKLRLHVIALASLTLIVFSGFSAFTSAESRLALIIGNGAYSKAATLKAPPNDAQLMAKVLRVLNFELFGGRVHVNVTQTQMLRLIKDFARGLNRQTVGLFYYSGHGMQFNNRNYILAIDTEIEDETDIRVRGISVDEDVLGRMSQAAPIISIVLLDACRNNRFEKRVKGLGLSKGLGDMNAERGSIIGFASEPNTVAYESKGKYSYFTEALAREIVKPDIPIIVMLRRVRVAVRNATNGKQIPTTRDGLFDAFYPLRSDRQDKQDTPRIRQERPSSPGEEVAVGVYPPQTTPTPYFPNTINNSIGMEFVKIPAGAFTMGSRDLRPRYANELPAHQVTISTPFYMGKYEVTQAQWQAVMGNNPSRLKSDERPVENVSWEDVQQFIRKLNEREKRASRLECRLPTEAEWEYAARAGSTTSYSFGDDSAQLGNHAWHLDNAGRKTHPVGQKQPNAWGLYDMHGNVFEWVEDWHGPYSADTATDPKGPDAGVNRVVRGGSWSRPAFASRSAFRGQGRGRDDDLGFRCAMSVLNQ